MILAFLCLCQKSQKKVFFAEFRIRMFLDLPDPHPDPYQYFTDPEHWFFDFFVLKTPPIELKELKV